jgi:hypothetical protein
MFFKALISPIAVAGLLALSAAMPASAAALSRSDAPLVSVHHQSVAVSNLTPAQRTKLEDDCRIKQMESEDSITGDDIGSSATASTCQSLGIPLV